MPAGEPGRPLRRGPGRPRSEGARDTRAAIIDAARRRFAADGVDRTTLRAVAADAGVDASLISHYFGGKAGLLVATMHLPIDPIALIRPMLAAGTEGLGSRILTTFLTAWDPHRDVISGLLRTAVGSAEQSGPLVEMVRTVIYGALVRTLPGPDVELRSGLLVSQIAGLALLRYVLRFEPVASASASDVVARYGPVLQAVIDG
jgi:AcrR family transcriptional regulator